MIALVGDTSNRLILAAAAIPFLRLFLTLLPTNRHIFNQRESNKSAFLTHLHARVARGFVERESIHLRYCWRFIPISRLRKLSIASIFQ